MKMGDISGWKVSLLGYYTTSNWNIVNKFYPESWIVWSYLTQNEEQRKTSAKNQNYHIEKFPAECLDKYWYSDKNTLQPNEERFYHIPIPVNWFNMGAVDMRHLNSDLRFNFKCSSDCVISGSVSDLSLEEFVLVVESSEDSAEDRQANHIKQISKLQ